MHLILFVVLLSLGNCLDLCPVSKHKQFLNGGYYSYPLEIFDVAAFNKTDKSLMTKCYVSDEKLNLQLRDLGIENEFRRNLTSCPKSQNEAVCPVVKKNVVLMTNITKHWVKPNYFCDLQQ